MSIELERVGERLASNLATERRAAACAIAAAVARDHESALIERAREDANESVRQAARAALDAWGVAWRQPLRAGVVDAFRAARPRVGHGAYVALVAANGESVHLYERVVAATRFDEGYEGVATAIAPNTLGSPPADWTGAWAIHYVRLRDEPTFGYRARAIEPLDALSNPRLVAHRALLGQAAHELATPWAPRPLATVAPRELLTQAAFWEAYYDAFFLLPDPIDERVISLADFEGVRERLFRGREMRRLLTAPTLPPVTMEEKRALKNAPKYSGPERVLGDRVTASNVRVDVEYTGGYLLTFEFDPLGVYMTLRHPAWTNQTPLGHVDPHHALPTFRVAEWERLSQETARVEGKPISAEAHRALLAPFVVVTETDDPTAAASALEAALIALGMARETATAIASSWSRPLRGRFREHPQLGWINTFRFSRRNERIVGARPMRAEKIQRFLDAATRVPGARGESDRRKPTRKAPRLP